MRSGRVPELAPADRAGGLVAGRQARLVLPLKAPKGSDLPEALQLGVRWQRLDPPTTSPDEGSSGKPASTPQPIEPPPVELVAAEQPGTIVSSALAKTTGNGLVLTVDLPPEPGRYRLTTTLHDTDGVAFDAPTQALLQPLLVQVSPPLSVAYGLASELTVKSGSAFELSLRLANNGSLPWADPPISFDPMTGRGTYNPAPTINIRWLALDAGTVETTAATIDGPRLGPGEETVISLRMTAPPEAGSYLVLVDVLSPLHGSLAAAGASFAETRITVQLAGVKVQGPLVR